MLYFKINWESRPWLDMTRVTHTVPETMSLVGSHLQRGGNAKAENWCWWPASNIVRLIVMPTHSHCLKILPCRMLSMAALLVKMLIHTTTLKLARNCLSGSIHPSRGAEEEIQIRGTNCLWHGLLLQAHNTYWSEILVEDSIMLSHELCAYPASIDQYRDLRQGNKSLLTAKLAIYITDQPVPDVEIADGNELLYHIT